MLHLSFANFKQNSFILIEGTPANDRFYIIQSGRVQSYHETPIPGNAPTMLGPGDFVGVISCMAGHSQTESVVALSDVSAIVVRRDQYPELIEKNTPVALKIVRAFAREMRGLNDNLAKITLKDTSITSSEMLFTNGEFYEEKDMLDVATFCYYQYLKEVGNSGTFYDQAAKRFAALKPRSHAVYFEPTKDMLREYPKDSMIFSEGQTGGDMFVIQDGSVKIVKVVNGNEIMLALLKKGDMFGEMALLDDSLRSASAIAYENCKLMVINRTNFNQMVATQPQYISKLTIVLADRLWSMYRQLANTQLQEPRARMIDMLALQLENKKVSVARGMSYRTDYTPQDIMNLCGIPEKDQYLAQTQLGTDQHIKFVGGVIVVPDVPELIKQAAFYRKQNSKRQNE